MDIVIIEDEYLASASLKKLLLKSPYSISVKQTLESVNQAIEWFKHNTCDLILSDIHLGDGESFEIFETLNIKTPIVFITAFDEYAIRSFQFFAIDYLLKPIDEDKLNTAIEKYINYSSIESSAKDDYNKKMNNLLLQMSVDSQKKKAQKRFLVSSGKRLISIKRGDIAYFMAQDKYLFLCTNNGNSYLYDDTITSLESKLPDRYFFKINRKYIIQHSAIKSITKHSNNRLRIELQPVSDDKSPILVSSKNITAFKEWLNQ